MAGWRGGGVGWGEVGGGGIGGGGWWRFHGFQSDFKSACNILFFFWQHFRLVQLKTESTRSGKPIYASLRLKKKKKVPISAFETVLRPPR